MQLYISNDDLTKKKNNSAWIPILLSIAAVVLLYVQFGPKNNPGANGGDNGDPAVTVQRDVPIPSPQQDPSCSEYISQGNSTKITVTAGKKWALKGKEFTADKKSIPLAVTLDQSISANDINVQYVVNENQNTNYLSPKSTTEYEGLIDTDIFDAGVYTAKVVVTAKCMYLESTAITFNVSYPVYVAWTTDWEGLTGGEYTTAMQQMETISRDNNLPITHMFNPRIYTSGFSQTTAQTYTDWVKARRDNYGDEIALHLHMFYDMVEAAGVTAKKTPKWSGSEVGGYNIPSSAYSLAEYEKILDWSIAKFEANGLGHPNSFRAGGWFADSTTLQALENKGIMIDSSGRTKDVRQIVDIQGYWDLEITSRPYHPSKIDHNTDKYDNRFELIEIPNNVGDSYGYNENELTDRFKQNYPGYQNRTPATSFTSAVYVSHPHWCSREFPRISKTLAFISGYKFENDNGPVIYATLSQIGTAWDLNNPSN